MITGNLEVRNNDAEFFRVADNVIGRNATIAGNTNEGLMRVLDNQVGGKLNCSGNTPSFLAAGNTVSKLNGQCAA